VQPVFKDQLAQLVQLDLKEFKVSQDQLELKVSRELQDQQVLKV
jgi:hypothetical protein